MQVHRRSSNHYVILLALLITIGTASCGGQKAELLLTAAKQPAGFELTIIEDEVLGPQQGEFSLQVEEHGDEVVVSVRVAGAHDLKAAYFELAYNSERFDPLAVEATGALQPVDEDDAGAELLTLQYVAERGRVYFGQVLPQTLEHAGFSGDATIAEARFAKHGFTQRAASAPPQTEASAVSLDWNVEDKVLSWGYRCQGDYNQDGMVTVNDLTPLGVHFQAEGPFDENSVQAVVDGNSDGMITVNDITPIGQNFNCRVEGYMVFASEDPGEVPAKEASEIAELEFIPLDAAQGDKITERLWFMQEFPDIDPNLMLWVRPIGDGEPGVPSWPQLPGLSMWQLHNVSNFADRQGGLANDVAVVGAMPAVAYADHYNDKLCYQRAMLVDGSTWAGEVVVENNAACSFVSLAVVNGHPAIAYADLTAGQMKYVRATNPQGSAWGTPVVIDDETATSSGTPLYYPELMIAGELPAIGYLDYSANEIRYCRALDADGASWGGIVKPATFQTPVTPADTGASFALIGGHPAVVYSDAQGSTLMFTRASNQAGSAWNTPVAVDGLISIGSQMSLFEVDGRPAAAYRAGTALRYNIGNDPAGTAWGTAVPVAANIGSGQHLKPSLHVNNAKPAIAFYHHDATAQSGYLGYVAAIDGQGTKWATATRIDDASITDDSGYCPNLINVGLNPAVSFCNVTAGEMWFAVNVDVFNQAPVAIVTPGVDTTKPGYEIEFDASASHDPDGEIVLYEWDWDDDCCYEESSGTNAIVGHAYEEPGVYIPHVRVSDNRGGSTRGFTSVEILENARPTAALVINPERGVVPFTVNFDASASYDDDGTIVNYEWDWDGDGVFEHESGNSPYWSWVYEHEGELQPAVKVYDNDGGTDTATVCCAGNMGPVAVAQATPNSGTAPFDVKLTSSGSFDPDGSIYQIWWDILDDGAYEYTAYNLNTWTCKMVWNGAVKVRLRVQDNDGTYGSTLITVNVTKGWHFSKVDEAGDVGSYNSLASINGRPAIAYYDYTNRYLKYVRASDAHGYGWPMPMSIGVISGASTPVCYGISLAWINGTRPGIAFAGETSTNWQDEYVVANDSNGTSWGSFVTVPQGTHSQPSLVVVAGNPAIASVNADTYFCRAANATGSGWNTQQSIETSSPPYGCQMAIINGNPAIVYCHRTPYPGMDEQVSYVRAGDAIGDSWGTPVRLDISNSMVDDIALCVINGQPAVAYVANDDTNAWGVHYMRANNANGTSWPASSKVIDNENRGSCALAEISGRPAVTFTASCDGGQLMFVRANDSNGAGWPVPMMVDAHLSVHCDMIELGGKPAISYSTAETIGGNETLRYAAWE